MQGGANQPKSRSKALADGGAAALHTVSRPSAILVWAFLCLAALLHSPLVFSYAAAAILFAGVTIIARHVVQTRVENERLIARLSEEKQLAESARETSEAAGRARAAFIANMSRELRTPVDAILGMAQLLGSSELEKAQRDHVKILLEAGRGLKTLLDDIIALAQYTDEERSSPEEGCDPGQAARTVARLLQPNAWEKRLRLSVNVASGLPRVGADSRLLRRLFLKLVSNAIKFTERGNIEITLECVCTESGASDVRFAVTDTGPGIPADLRAMLFEPFAKTGDQHMPGNARAGLGLAVAKRLVDSMGGCIGVESEPGMGASFWVTLPAIAASATENSQPDEEVTPPTGLSLLIHLPDESMRTEVEHWLEPFGNAVTVAGTLAQAATMSARGGFALIIAGAESVDSLAAIPGQHTPIIALIKADESPPGGADAMLRWPTRANALYAAIASLSEQASRATEDAKEDMEASIDSKAIADLQKSVGLKTVIDILQSYLLTSEELATALISASDKEDWGQAARVAQDFAGAAGGLGLTAVTAAARLLAQGARDGVDHQALLAATDEVLSQHRRADQALRRLYPDIAA